jgi:LPS sulfotransferase NodH
VASSSPQPDTVRAVRHPAAFRLLNGAGPALRRLPLDLLSLSPDRLMSAAVSRTGLDDFGARDFETGLAVLTNSAERDARLTTIGRLAVRQHILSALTTRLLEEALRKQGSAQPDEAGIRSMVIVGLPRSGTTLLHRLLALKPGARGLAYWEVRNPVKPHGRDRRLAWATRQLALLDTLAPGFKAMHQVRAEDPEECWFLLDSSMTSCTFWMTAPVYGYLDWCLGQDQSAGYARYREHLLRFSAERPDQQLVLKAPIHTMNLRLLRQALPEATIIQIHRDPVACVNSVNSLTRELQGAVTDHVDSARLGRANLDLLVQASRRGAEDRAASWQGEPVIDVYYEDLVADPLGVLRTIFHRTGGDFSPEHQHRVRSYLLNDPASGHGPHRYRSGDFGLRDDDIRREFEGCYARFPRLAGKTSRAPAEGSHHFVG